MLVIKANTLYKWKEAEIRDKLYLRQIPKHGFQAQAQESGLWVLDFKWNFNVIIWRSEEHSKSLFRTDDMIQELGYCELSLQTIN